MRFLPIVALTAALLGVVAMMAGDKEKGLQAIRNIAVVVVGMLILVALFSLITASRL